MCGSAAAVTPAVTPTETNRNTSVVDVDYPTQAVSTLKNGQMFKRAKSTGDFAVYMACSHNNINLETGWRVYGLYGLREEQVYPLPKGSLVKLVQG